MPDSNNDQPTSTDFDREIRHIVGENHHHIGREETITERLSLMGKDRHANAYLIWLARGKKVMIKKLKKKKEIM